MRPKSTERVRLPGAPVQHPPDPVIVGHIARAVGVHGEVKVTVDAEDKSRLKSFKKIFVSLGEECRQFTIESLKLGDSYCQVKFVEIDSRQAATQVAGGDIIISRSERPELSDSAFYIDDLIGCRVETDTGDELGLIVEVWPQAHHDIWVIDGAAGDILIPAVRQFITQVDLKQHKVVVSCIDGLIE